MQCLDSEALEPEIGAKRVSNLLHETTKRSLADEQVSALLVLPNFPQCDSTRTVPLSKRRLFRN